MKRMTLGENVRRTRSSHVYNSLVRTALIGAWNGYGKTFSFFKRFQTHPTPATNSKISWNRIHAILQEYNTVAKHGPENKHFELVGRSVDEGPEKLDLMSIQINCEEHVVRRHHGFLNSCRKEARKLGKCLTAEYLDLKTLTQSQHFTPELTKTLWPCGQHNTLQPYHAPPRHPGSRPRVFV